MAKRQDLSIDRIHGIEGFLDVDQQLGPLHLLRDTGELAEQLSG
jgi:hypothetical protein